MPSLLVSLQVSHLLPLAHQKIPLCPLPVPDQAHPGQGSGKASLPPGGPPDSGPGWAPEASALTAVLSLHIPVSPVRVPSSAANGAPGAPGRQGLRDDPGGGFSSCGVQKIQLRSFFYTYRRWAHLLRFWFSRARTRPGNQHLQQANSSPPTLVETESPWGQGRVCLVPHLVPILSSVCVRRTVHLYLLEWLGSESATFHLKTVSHGNLL